MRAPGRERLMMSGIRLKTPPEIAKMRMAGRIVARTLELVGGMVAPGVTTAELDRAAEEFIEKQGGKPSFKGYRGFPATLCTSIDAEVVHGIPGRRALVEGELLKIDCGAIWEGFHGDAAATFPVGRVGDEARRLMAATRRALDAGIAAARPGARVADISAAVQSVAERYGFSLVTQYAGHGIGREMHEEPRVPNVVASRFLAASPVLEAGAVLAIEPMVNVGTHLTEVLDDGWTVVTRDRKLSCHFEHTVAVEHNGAVILTLP